MDYWEADQLCQKNKEFIFSLFPTGKIYTTFLPAEARNAIGKVGKDTEPVVHMLKKIGFEYNNQVDPFDAGPHFWANVDDIVPVKKLGVFRYDSATVEQAQGQPVQPGLLAKTEQRAGEFRALAVNAVFLPRGPGGSKSFCVVEPPEATLSSVLSVSPGDSVAFMPYY